MTRYKENTEEEEELTMYKDNTEEEEELTKQKGECRGGRGVDKAEMRMKRRRRG